MDRSITFTALVQPFTLPIVLLATAPGCSTLLLLRQLETIRYINIVRSLSYNGFGVIKKRKVFCPLVKDWNFLFCFVWNKSDLVWKSNNLLKEENHAQISKTCTRNRKAAQNPGLRLLFIQPRHLFSLITMILPSTCNILYNSVILLHSLRPITVFTFHYRLCAAFQHFNELYKMYFILSIWLVTGE